MDVFLPTSKWKEHICTLLESPKQRFVGSSIWSLQIFWCNIQRLYFVLVRIIKEYSPPKKSAFLELHLLVFAVMQLCPFQSLNFAFPSKCKQLLYFNFKFSNRSLRSPESPERVIETPVGVTALDFSSQHPNLLAVGLYSGNIAIYDLKKVWKPPPPKKIFDTLAFLSSFFGGSILDSLNYLFNKC